MAAGTVDGQPVVDDVDFAGAGGPDGPEVDCTPPVPGCTDPNGTTTLTSHRQPPEADPEQLHLPGARGPRPVLRPRPGQHQPLGRRPDLRPGRPDPGALPGAARGRADLAGVVRADRSWPRLLRRDRRGLGARRGVHLPHPGRAGPLPARRRGARRRLHRGRRARSLRRRDDPHRRPRRRHRPGAGRGAEGPLPAGRERGRRRGLHRPRDRRDRRADRRRAPEHRPLRVRREGRRDDRARPGPR